MVTKALDDRLKGYKQVKQVPDLELIKRFY